MADTQLLDPQIRNWENPHTRGIQESGPVCPLTGSQNVEVMEEIPTSLLVDCYQRDLGINVSSEFLYLQKVQLCRCLDSNLIFFYPCLTGSSEFYKQLYAFDWYSPASKFEYTRAAAWVKPGDRLLEIGCGTGWFANIIPDAVYTGLEPNLVPGVKAQDLNCSILADEVSTHAMEFSQTYDVVCAFQVLEHVADPRAFLRAALTCLKGNGLLILGVPSADSYITKIPNLVLNAPPHHNTWWTDRGLFNLADQFQLSILELAHAPVELWEIRLYWMQRILGLFSPQASSHFTESRTRRLLNMAAYVVAGFIQASRNPPVDVQGASVVLIGRKIPSKNRK